MNKENLNPARWAVLQGAAAKVCGRKRSACPYAKHSGLAFLWLGGWRLGTASAPLPQPYGARFPWLPHEEEALTIAGTALADAELARIFQRTPQAIRLKRLRLARATAKE